MATRLDCLRNTFEPERPRRPYGGSAGRGGLRWPRYSLTEELIDAAKSSIASGVREVGQAVSWHVRAADLPMYGRGARVLGRGAWVGARATGRFGVGAGKLGLAGGALLAGLGAVGIGGGLYEAYGAGQQCKSEEESDYMQKLLATAQQGPFGTGLRPYGMGSNFGGSAGMSLAMHYARNGTGIRNPLFSIASLASRDIRRSMS